MDVEVTFQSLVEEIFDLEKKFREKISNSSTDFSEIFIKLQEIGNHFQTFSIRCNQLYESLELLLLTYLDFLDFDQFAEVAIEENQWGNNIFLRAVLDTNTDLRHEYFNQYYSERPDQSVSRLLKRLASSNRIIDSLNVEKTMKFSLQTTCHSLLILGLRMISHYSSVMVEIELEKYQDKLVLPMINYLEKYLEETTNSAIKERTVFEIFLFFSLVPNYRIQIVPLLIKWDFLSICCKVLSGRSYPVRIYEHALVMTYGLICHDDGQKALVDSNGVELTIEFCKFCNQNLLFLANESQRKNIVPLIVGILVTIDDTNGSFKYCVMTVREGGQRDCRRGFLITRRLIRRSHDQMVFFHINS